MFVIQSQVQQAQQMTPTTSRAQVQPPRILSDDERWRAVEQRDPAADGLFVYAVQTTGIFCRPVCPSRRALRQNVRFFATNAAAERAGFRPCKRCRPTDSSQSERHTAMIIQACRLIEAADTPFSLDDLARSVGLSRYHFHRLFKTQVGITPKAYAAACRSLRVQDQLARGVPVTTSIYNAGYHSNSRFYESSAALLGMTPKAYQAGGAGTVLRFGIGECGLGAILVAASEIGVCCILLGDDPQRLALDLQDRFPKAELIGADPGFERLVAAVIGFVDDSAAGLDLPLDVRGTAFQQQVWQALRQIPVGSTATYTEIAARIGRPLAVRAVAQACGANPLAVAIPCHRVVRTDGSLAGYRWGVERKSELLRRERDAAEQQAAAGESE